MHVFRVRVAHLTEDFTLPSESSCTWSCLIKDAEELKRLLNRVAIATTQLAVVEFPEVEIGIDSRRILVRAIEGKLFYSEPESRNRRDIEVVPSEVIRLLEGESVMQALRRDDEADFYRRQSSHKARRSQSSFKIALLLVSCVSFVLALSYSFQGEAGSAGLVEPPDQFEPVDYGGEIFRRFADVYISELREGATVIEIKETGECVFYELWQLEDGDRYSVAPVMALSASAGFHLGQPALLAGEYHLLRFHNDDLRLHGIHYKRYGKELATLGDLLPGPL